MSTVLQSLQDSVERLQVGLNLLLIHLLQQVLLQTHTSITTGVDTYRSAQRQRPAYTDQVPFVVVSVSDL